MTNNSNLPNTPTSPLQSETEGDLDSEDTTQDPPQPTDESLDNAVEETFPASDPISP